MANPLPGNQLWTSTVWKTVCPKASFNVNCVEKVCPKASLNVNCLENHGYARMPYSTLEHQLSPKLSIHMSAKLPMFRPQRDFQRLSYINIIVNASKGKSNVSNNNNEIIDPSY